MSRAAAPARTETSTRKSDVTREAILASAARAFRADGYSAARLNDIAAGAGMQAGSLYYHFASREALVEAVMTRGVERTHAALVDALARLPAEADPLTRLAVAIETHLEMIVRQEEIASATIKLIWQVPPAIRERALEGQRAYGDLWKELLGEARAAGAIRADLNLSVVRMAIMGALNWAADWVRPASHQGEGMSVAAIARDITAMTLHGLATPKP